MTPQSFLDYMTLNQLPVSARGLHSLMGIRMPYSLWLYLRVTSIESFRQPEDYCFVQKEDGRDCELSPVTALIVACQGGSPFAAKVQVLYCRYLSEVVFKGRNPIEVIDTGIKVAQAEELLARSFDPERET